VIEEQFVEHGEAPQRKGFDEWSLRREAVEKFPKISAMSGIFGK
jgi:hypothetical protein